MIGEVVWASAQEPDGDSEYRSLSSDSFLPSFLPSFIHSYICVYSFNKYLLKVHSARTENISKPPCPCLLALRGLPVYELESHTVPSTFGSYQTEIIIASKQDAFLSEQNVVLFPAASLF